MQITEQREVNKYLKSVHLMDSGVYLFLLVDIVPVMIANQVILICIDAQC